MGKISGLLRLGRPYTSILGSLGVLSASVAAIGVRVLDFGLSIIIATILVFVFNMGANSLNDYIDRSNDEINHPERPIPSKQIKPVLALYFSGILFVLSGIIAAILSILVGVGAFLLFFVAFILQIAYEYNIKKLKFLGNYVIAVLTVLAFLLGGVVVKSILIAAILASTAFLAILAREIVKDIEDIRGDLNRISLPKIIGIRNANTLASVLLITAISISIAAFYPLFLLGKVYLILILATDSLFLICIPFIFKNSRIARRLLKFAMLCALLSFVFGGVFG